MIYIGESAGSYVACPTIEMARWKGGDKEEFGLTDLSGLGLISFLITAHYNPSVKEAVDKAAKNQDRDVYKLTDNDMLIIEDDKVEEITI